MIKRRNNRYIRLKSTLLNSQIQQDNPALYEVINQILEGLQDYENFTGEVNSEISRIPTIPGTGGSGLPSGIKGNLLYHDGTEWKKLDIGTEGQILSAFGDLPYWTDLEPGSGTLPEGLQANVSRSTDLVVNNDTQTTIPFTTGSASVWNSAQATRITIPTTGTYLTELFLSWDILENIFLDSGPILIIYKKNGATFSSNMININPNTPEPITLNSQLFSIHLLNENDYLEIDILFRNNISETITVKNVHFRLVTLGINIIEGTSSGLPEGVLGDIIYYNGDNWTKLPIGTPTQFLMTDGNTPLWQDLSSPNPNIRTSIYRSSNLVIDTTTVTPIPFNTVVTDTHDLWSSGQPTRITVSIAGIYIVHAATEWFSSGFGNFHLIIRKNGLEQFRTLLPAVGLEGTGGPGYQGIDSLTILLNLVPGDYIESAVQWSGGASIPAEVIGGQTRTTLQINNLATHSITIIQGETPTGGGFQEIIEHGEVGANKTIDWATSDKHHIILNSPFCNLDFTNPPTDRGLLLISEQDNVGNRKINWPSNVVWSYAKIPESGIAGRVDLYTFFYLPALNKYIGSFNLNYSVS